MVVFLLKFLYYHVRIQTNTKGGNIAKRILSLIVGFCLVIGLFFPFTTGAASKAEERLDVQVEATTNSIKLSWTGIADHYEVVEGGKEEKKVWSGAKTSFIQKDLESDRSYSYIIAAYDKEKKLITKANVNSSTLKTDAQVKKELSSLKDEYHPMIEARLEAIQEENEIRLVWHDLPDEDGEYEVYRDNKLYVDSAQANYRDIKMENEDRGSDWIYHEMTMASKHPLLDPFAPAIDASYKAKIYKTLHNSEFSGKHDRAPSHEMYLMEYYLPFT